MNEEYLKWLKRLIEENDLEKFYHDTRWLKVSARVKEIDNHECQRCKREGRVTTAGTVNEEGKRVQMSAHHRKEVRKHPELALSIFYIDGEGKRRRNIEYLCETCHNKEHYKFQSKKEKGFMNEERW